MSIIYTPLPLETVLDGIDKQDLKYQEIEVGGAKLLVEQMGVDNCRVVRLISTNPADYLRNEFQPGTELKFVPQFGWNHSDEGNGNSSLS